MNFVKKLILILIIALAFVLRFYRLDTYPALNADEAAIGYNAYSLLQTGKDEHGSPWPIHFQSFNDYKPGLYFYLVMPFVKVLGLNEWAVRIPGATLGVLSVLIVYFLVKELFKNERLAIFSSLFLAISPWHIHFSRGGWEVNTATFFLTLGIWLFIKSANNNFGLKYLLISIVAFVASLYTYHAERVIVPLLGVGLTIIYWKEIKTNLKKIAIASLIGVVLLLPLAKDIASGAVASRAAGVGLFADTGPFNRINEQRGEHASLGSLPSKILHNKAVNYGLAFAQNWASHFHGEFLFLSGDAIQRNKVPETGQMYLFDILFLAIGIFAITRSFSKEWKVIVLWLVIAPTAAALTFQAPHALRAHNMVIPLVIISAFGLSVIAKHFKTVGWILVGALIVWQFARYEHMYWVHMAKEYPYSSQYGVKELVSYVQENQDKYQKILMTDRYDQPYILFLFYGAETNSMKYDPARFQAEHTLTPRDSFGFSTVNHFDKYYFAAIKFDQARPENPNTMIVGTDNDIPKEANIVKEIYGTNGFKYFKIVAN